MISDIPPFQLIEFHGKKTPYALVIGVYNEGEKFARQLLRLQPYRDQIDILIADGMSDDGATTPDALKNKARALLIHPNPLRGLSAQYRDALRYALAQNYEAVIMMDGNDKDGADAIPRFIEKLKESYDFVQGSRFMPGGRHERTPIDRVIGIRFVFNPIMALASGFRYTDAMNGFKACSRRFLLDPRVQPLRDVFRRYNLQYYFNYIAPKLGFKIVEIPVSRIYPYVGAYSKIKGLRGRISLMIELLRTVTGGYNP